MILRTRIGMRTKTKHDSPRIDVVMPTKNSAKTLRRSLDAVYREIPVCHLIVVDANSRDETVEILKGYPNVDLIQGPWHLGKAREIGVKRVHTDLFMFVDSDVEIRPNCLREMLACMSASHIGAVEGTGETWNRFQKSKRLSRVFRLRRERPYTGTTLVRTSAINDIRLPNVVLYEDYLIREHVESKGFRWTKTKRRFTTPLSTYLERDPKQEILAGEYAWKFEREGNGYFLPFLLLLKIVYAFAFAHTYSSENALKANFHQAFVDLYYTCGILKARFSNS